MDVWEIRMIVKDTKLREALRELKPYALEHPVVIPVDKPGAEEIEMVPVSKPTTARKTKAKAKSNGRRDNASNFRKNGQNRGQNGAGLVALVRGKIMDERPPQITSTQLKALMRDNNYAPSSYFYPLRKLMDEGIIEPIAPGDRSGVYNVKLPATDTSSLVHVSQH